MKRNLLWVYWKQPMRNRWDNLGDLGTSVSTNRSKLKVSITQSQPSKITRIHGSLSRPYSVVCLLIISPLFLILHLQCMWLRLMNINPSFLIFPIYLRLIMPLSWLQFLMRRSSKQPSACSRSNSEDKMTSLLYCSIQVRISGA